MWEPTVTITVAPRPPTAAEWARAGVLEWARQGMWRRAWDLHDAGKPLATLRYVSVLPQGIEVVTPTGRWHAARRATGLELRRDGASEPVARYRPARSAGRILRPGSEELLWRRQSWWRGGWSITDREGAPLLHFVRTSPVRRSGGRIEIEEAARLLPDLEALVALGWILAIRCRHAH